MISKKDAEKIKAWVESEADRNYKADRYRIVYDDDVYGYIDSITEPDQLSDLAKGLRDIRTEAEQGEKSCEICLFRVDCTLMSDRTCKTHDLENFVPAEDKPNKMEPLDTDQPVYGVIFKQNIEYIGDLGGKINELVEAINKINKVD